MINILTCSIILTLIAIWILHGSLPVNSNVFVLLAEVFMPFVDAVFVFHKSSSDSASITWISLNSNGFFFCVICIPNMYSVSHSRMISFCKLFLYIIIIIIIIIVIITAIIILLLLLLPLWMRHWTSGFHKPWS